jgi:hypothetical protein
MGTQKEVHLIISGVDFGFLTTTRALDLKLFALKHFPAESIRILNEQGQEVELCLELPDSLLQ